MANKNNSKRQTNKQNEKPTPVEAIGRGIALVESGDRQAAFDIFQETAELNPDMAEAWVWLGGTSSTIDAAALAFERASSLDPQNEEASLGLRWVSLQRAASAQATAGAPVPATTEGLPVPAEIPAPASTALEPVSQIVSPKVMCPNCGTQNSTSEKFCVQCGQNLSAAAQQGKARSAGALRRLDKRRVAVLAVAVLVLAALLIWYLVMPH